MQWKEALYIKNSEQKINQEIYEALLRLPEIRDECFSMYYKYYGYKRLELIYGEFETNRGLTSYIDFHLLSLKANRVIALSYIFMNNDYELGIISDNINLADATKGWGISIYLNLLAKNRGFNIDERYNIPTIYSGNAVEQLEACMKQIKLNYDTIAPDIISGEHWDKDAWNIGAYF